MNNTESEHLRNLILLSFPSFVDMRVASFIVLSIFHTTISQFDDRRTKNFFFTFRSENQSVVSTLLFRFHDAILRSEENFFQCNLKQNFQVFLQQFQFQIDFNFFPTVLPVNLTKNCSQKKSVRVKFFSSSIKIIV